MDDLLIYNGTLGEDEHHGTVYFSHSDYHETNSGPTAKPASEYKIIYYISLIYQSNANMNSCISIM